MTQRLLPTLAPCPVRSVPAGVPSVIPEGEFVSITQALGGNFTVTWQGNMYRIDGSDAQAIGQEVDLPLFEAPLDGQISEAQINDALDSIFDPEIPVSILALGLIYGVVIDQASGQVTIEMTLTAPACGMGPVLVGDVEYRLNRVPHVKTVRVNLVFDPPWSRDMMSEEAQLEVGLFF